VRDELPSVKQSDREDFAPSQPIAIAKTNTHMNPSCIQRTTGTQNSALLAAAQRTAARLFDVCAEFRRRSVGRADLASMRERERRDLGLSAAQVLAEIDKPFWRL
jgi:uncharacterized protein YjiS (DUF1127 family)